jgi:hypothetical protein
METNGQKGWVLCKLLKARECGYKVTVAIQLREEVGEEQEEGEEEVDEKEVDEKDEKEEEEEEEEEEEKGEKGQGSI